MNQGKYYSRLVSLLANLYVRNAFTSARRQDVLQALGVTFKIVEYLRTALRGYFHNRELVYDTREEPGKKNITAEV